MKQKYLIKADGIFEKIVSIQDARLVDSTHPYLADEAVVKTTDQAQTILERSPDNTYLSDSSSGAVPMEDGFLTQDDHLAVESASSDNNFAENIGDSLISNATLSVFAPLAPYLLSLPAVAALTSPQPKNPSLMGTGSSASVLGIHPIAGDNIVNASEASGILTISGTKVTDATISLTIGNLYTNTITGSGTSWSQTLTPSELSRLADGTYSVSVIQSDATGNTNATQTQNFTVDTMAPLFSSGISGSFTAYSDSPTRIVYAAHATDTGMLTYSLLGVDASFFDINPSTGDVTFKVAPTLDPRDADANNVYALSVIATDTAGNSSAQNVAIAVTAPTTLSLGTQGNLIHPIQVEGKWYYYWDRSGDLGVNNADMTDHNTLDDLFTQDVNGSSVGYSGDTDNTYRYASLGGLKVALPTYGAAVDAGGVASSLSVFMSGTAAANNTTIDNPIYDDLLAIWDSQNGNSAGATNVYGFPTNWENFYWWSATPSPAGHAYVDFSMGVARNYTDTNNDNFVALQVL